MDMTVAVQTAMSKADHEALAAHYEQAAKDAEVQVDEHKKLLAQYQAHSYLYGRQAQTFESHCEALIHSYEQVADANTKMAEMHRQLAGECQQLSA